MEVFEFLIDIVVTGRDHTYFYLVEVEVSINRDVEAWVKRSENGLRHDYFRRCVLALRALRPLRPFRVFRLPPRKLVMRLAIMGGTRY